MSKLYLAGGILCLGGFLILLFQGISSMMNPGEIVWKSTSIVGLVDAAHLKWIDNISMISIHKLLKYIINLPLYILMLGTGGLLFLIGGFTAK